MSNERTHDENADNARRIVGDWALAAVLTLLACIISVRLAMGLESQLLLCAGYCVPAALTIRDAYRGIASFSAVAICGLVVLSDQSYTTKMSFVVVGVAMASLVVYVSSTVEAKLKEARLGLGLTRARSAALRQALDVAGVPLIIMNNKGTWLSSNEAALRAVGISESVYGMSDMQTHLDTGAAEALMHSASRSAWLQWLERYKSAESLGTSSSTRSQSGYYEDDITLFDADATPRTFRLRAFRGQVNELIIVACPPVEA